MKICTLDLETDPFHYGEMVQPFTLGFYDGSQFVSIWGRDCVERFVDNFLPTRPEKLTLYAHNGGRFDFFWFLKYLHGKAKIINNRIVQASIGKHELRDSYAIIPVPLADYKKDTIDYEIFRESKREAHREKIIEYLRGDCVYLHELCTAFVKQFGPKLTIGGTAMKELKARHSFDETNESTDLEIREKFYYGGRNQVFKAGVIPGPIYVYDVNSMYPFVMKEMLHPVSSAAIHGTEISDATAFVSVRGRNHGAFPSRQKDGSLDFTREKGVFHVTIHEYRAGIETGTFEPQEVIETYDFEQFTCFDTFVDDFYQMRMTAADNGDEINKLFYKLVLNSGYGKFAQNPENYFDWCFSKIGTLPGAWHNCYEGVCEENCKMAWEIAFISQNEYILWKRPVRELKYYNVATGASITGAARSLLLRGLGSTTKPYYCDTDSIICGAPLKNITTHQKQLGAWKNELTTPGSTIAVCGKKLYAIYDASGNVLKDDSGKEKKAHKGARLTGQEILRIAKGATIESVNPVPAFKWDGRVTWTKRNIRKTAKTETEN